MNIFSGLFLALLTALVWAIFDLVSRPLSVRSQNPLALSVLYNIVGGVFALTFLLVEPGKFAGITAMILALTFFITLLYGIVEATQFFARKYLEVSYSSILFQLTPIVTLVGAILFLGEQATSEKIPQKIIGVILTFVGVTILGIAV